MSKKSALYSSPARKLTDVPGKPRAFVSFEQHEDADLTDRNLMIASTRVMHHRLQSAFHSYHIVKFSLSP